MTTCAIVSPPLILQRVNAHGTGFANGQMHTGTGSALVCIIHYIVFHQAYHVKRTCVNVKCFPGISCETDLCKCEITLNSCNFPT